MDDTTKWYMMLARMRKTAKERSQADADANVRLPRLAPLFARS